jgi:hypothetical protein
MRHSSRRDSARNSRRLSNGNPKRPLRSISNGRNRKHPLPNINSDRNRKRPLRSINNGRSRKHPLRNINSDRNRKRPLRSINNGRNLKRPLRSTSSGHSPNRPLRSLSSGHSLNRPLRSLSNGRSLNRPLRSLSNGRSLKLRASRRRPMEGTKAIARIVRADPIAAMRSVGWRGIYPYSTDLRAIAAGSACERFHKARNRHPRRCGAQGYAKDLYGEDDWPCDEIHRIGAAAGPPIVGDGCDDQQIDA